MAFGLGDGVMTFGGDDSDFQRVADNVERRMKQVADTFSSFAFSHPQFQTVIKGLDDVDKGAGRAAESLLKIGRVSIFTRAADGLRSMAQEAEKFTTEIAKGNANVNDLVEAMAKKIPFGIGALVEVGRDIHGLITGDTAANAKNDADAAATEKKIDFQTRLEAAVRKVARAGEEANQKLNFTIGKSPFLDSIETILRKGQNVAQDQRTELNSNQKLLDEGTERRKVLLKQLEDIRAKPDIVHTTDPGEPTVFIPRSGEINDAERAIAKLDESLQSYRDRIGELNEVLTEKGGRPTFTAIFKLVGEEGSKAFDQAVAAIVRYLSKSRELMADTKRLQGVFDNLAQSRAGNIGIFNSETLSLGIDKARGLISSDAFTKLSDKSFFDQAARSVGSILNQYAPIVETITRLIDSNLGISGFAQRLGAQLGSIVPGRIDTSPNLFKSSTLGLTDLGKRIQEGAASEHKGQDATDKYLPTMDKSLKDAASALQQFLKLNLGTVK